MLYTNEFDGTVNTFGPVPSRRFGRSLGIVNVPPNTCTYDCIYCQVGRTCNMTLEQQPWYNVDTILESVARRESQVRNLGERVDFVSFVPNGEPTLDINLEAEVSVLRSVGIQTAIITNASLISRSDVREALRLFDRVSVKVDTVDEKVWRRVNRPHKNLKLNAILDGLVEFSNTYRGTLDSETVLVRGVNDQPEDLEQLAKFLKRLNPHTAYLSIPTRPPSETWVRIPTEKSQTTAYAIFSKYIDEVEILTGYEGDNFVSSGDVKEDLLAIAGVYPMRKSAVRAFIENTDVHWEHVKKLFEQKELVAIPYRGETYYSRKRQKNRTAVTDISGKERC